MWVSVSEMSDKKIFFYFINMLAPVISPYTANKLKNKLKNLQNKYHQRYWLKRAKYKLYWKSMHHQQSFSTFCLLLNSIKNKKIKKQLKIPIFCNICSCGFRKIKKKSMNMFTVHRVWGYVKCVCWCLPFRVRLPGSKSRPGAAECRADTLNWWLPHTVACWIRWRHLLASYIVLTATSLGTGCS